MEYPTNFVIITKKEVKNEPWHVRKPEECTPYLFDITEDLNLLEQDGEEDLNKYWKSVNSLALAQLHESQKIVNELKCSMLATLRAARKGYSRAMWMYQVIFALGVFLIVAALAVGLFQGYNTLALLLTSAGTLNLLTFLVRDPPRLLQQNRAQLTKIMAAHFSWWTDSTSLNLWLYGGISDITSKPSVTLDDLLKISEAETKNACALMEMVKDD